MDEELLENEDEVIINEDPITEDEVIIDEDPIAEDETGTYKYAYEILDESNEVVIDPDLTLGYLKKEYFTIHHESIPEQWHYEVVSFDFADGEVYTVASQFDPHVQIIDAHKGIFKYIPGEGEESRVVTGQTISPVIDSGFIDAWDETKTFYRYVLYTEKELNDRDFLANGPAQLAEAQELIEDLLLVIADLLGGADEEEME